jgi:hypothetical protein
MRVLGGFCLALLLATTVLAQQRGFVNVQPTVQGSFGNIVFPGGTASTMPGIQRTFGSVVFPGGGGPRLNVPLSSQDPTRLNTRSVAPNRGYFGGQRLTRSTGAVAVPYAVPVYAGGAGYDNSYLPPQAAPQQQPNIIVIYPPAGQPVYLGGSGDGQLAGAPPQAIVTQPAEEPAAGSEPAHYLIAFKDHTIYSAVAYWVEGNTLHYFTTGNTHNQVSLALVDRDLTERLNRESGTNLQLPK